MKIVFLTVWYSEKMGYIENTLSKALVKQGHEVHVITSTAQVYYNEPNYDMIYKPYLGANIQPAGVKDIDGYKLHRLPFKTISGKMYLLNLGKTIKEIQPDVVQAFDAFSFLTLQIFLLKFLYTFKLFTANHTVASVFPLLTDKNVSIWQRIFFYFTRTVPGWIVSTQTSLCYPATIDAEEIAVKYYGVPKRKSKMVALGVDTDFFNPSKSPEKIDELNRRRKSLGFNENELLCIYTGRFTEGKNPLCLAQAIEKLVEQGEPFRALFMGDGPQADEIRKMKGCIVHKFVPYHQLPDYYKMSDIGVWPRQESTSMIDATACGLPIVISNRVQAKERVEGNGLTYEENNVSDLMKALLQLKDVELRNKLTTFGVEKIMKTYSWDKIAKDRIEDYRKFLKL